MDQHDVDEVGAENVNADGALAGDSAGPSPPSTAPAPPMKRRAFSKRKAITYGLCLLIFAGAVVLALRMSFPPDPTAQAIRRAARERVAPGVSADKEVLTIETEDGTRRYRFHETENGLVAEEVEEK